MDRRAKNRERNARSGHTVSRRRFLTTAVMGGVAAAAARSTGASHPDGAARGAKGNPHNTEAGRLLARYGGEFGEARGDEHGGF